MSFRTLIALAALAPLSATAVTYVDIPVTGARDHAFDPAGNLYITAGNRLLRYDIGDCTLFARGLGTSLQGVDISGDGRYIAVADHGLLGGTAHVFLYDTQYLTGTRAPARISYAPYSLESGSFMVAFSASNQLYISGRFAGSGWVPLRRYDPIATTMTTVRSVRQDTMLAMNREGNRLALVEADISSGPVRVLDAANGLQLGTANMNWFGFEVAIDGGGTRVVSPSYNGAFVYDLVGSSLVQAGLIGQYADNGPAAAVFSPDSELLVTTSYSRTTSSLGGLRLYDAASLAHVMTLDPYLWSTTGNHAMGQGRLTVSHDGRWLAATQSGRVRLYDVSAELGTDDPTGGPSCATTSIAPFRDVMQRRDAWQYDRYGNASAGP